VNGLGTDILMGAYQFPENSAITEVEPGAREDAGSERFDPLRTVERLIPPAEVINACAASGEAGEDPLHLDCPPVTAEGRGNAAAIEFQQPRLKLAQHRSSPLRYTLTPLDLSSSRTACGCFRQVKSDPRRRNPATASRPGSG
jgi:hypothetical protein